MKPRWFENPRLDYVLAVIPVSAHLFWTWRTGRGDVLAWGGAEQRLQAYIITGAVAALMLTVGTSSLALYVGGGGRRLSEFREDAGQYGLALILSLVTSLLLLSLVAIVAVIIDIEDDSNAWVRWAFEYALLLVVGRAVRAFVLYRNQIHGQLYDSLDERPPSAKGGAAGG